MLTVKKNDKLLTKLLFKLTEAERFGFVEVPEDWEILEDNTGEVICTSCAEFVKIEYFPYAYDKKNNEVHYVGICPKCGDYIYICD